MTNDWVRDPPRERGHWCLSLRQETSDKKQCGKDHQDLLPPMEFTLYNQNEILEFTIHEHVEQHPYLEEKKLMRHTLCGVLLLASVDPLAEYDKGETQPLYSDNRGWQIYQL